MTKRILSLMILSLLLFALTAMTAFAARTAEETRTRGVDPLLTRIQQYGIPDENNLVPGEGMGMPKAALGSAAPSASPGVVLGNTWYDYQRNGSMRRMVTHRLVSTGTPPQPGYESPFADRVHFVWMRMTDSALAGVGGGRYCHYKCWNAATGQFDCEADAPISGDDYSGYCVVNATHDDRGVPGGHNATPGIMPNMSESWWDDVPGVCQFFNTCRVPADMGDDCQYEPDGTGHIWPAMCLQENATDTFLHVFAQESVEEIAAPQPIAYYRQYGLGLWDQFYCVDTVHDLAQDCDCTAEGKVVLAWNANVPEPGDCDTCSSHDYWSYVQRNNDVYVQVSNNSGVDWNPRINVTKYVEGEEGFRAYTDLSVLIDSKDSVHVVWNGLYWPADAEAGGTVTDFRCRIFHWSGVDGEKDPNDINMVHDADWVMDSCAPGAWTLNASKMTISECDDKMYVLFVQFNDSNAVTPVVDDCAVASSPGGWRGRPNGELYVCVSDNWGDTWDKARNLTNTYTPGCTLVAPGLGNCESENWPSMTKFGTDYIGAIPWPEAAIVDLDPDYVTDWYLDVQYVADNSAGGVIQNQGWWTQSDVKWFRLKCVPIVLEANLVLTPKKYGYPTWTKHGVFKDTTLMLENFGNCGLTYTVTKFETTTPAGWLSVTGAGGSIAAGGSATSTVHMNTGGIVNTPGTIVHLAGSLYVDWQGSACPPDINVREVVPIDCWVTDTLYTPFWDTIHTACTKLIVANTGNFGAGTDSVNLDYAADGDEEEAAVYLYDGSPVIGYQKNAGTPDHDTVVNFSIFSTSYIDENGFIPLGDYTSTTDMGEYEVFETGKFVTHDSLIAIEKIWYAPKDDPANCSFVIQCMKIYLNDTLADPPTDVRIGEAIDWDIPADSNSRNYSGVYPPLNLLWQKGSEEDTLPPSNCDMRWGGMDFLEAYKNGKLISDAPYGGYIKDNNTQVYPEGGFHPDSLYKHMGVSGFVDSDTQNTDLHMVMIKIHLEALLKGDTILIFEEIVSHRNGNWDSFIAEVLASIQWYKDHIKPISTTCCNHDGMRGDVDGNSSLNIGDAVYLVQYIFFSGDPPSCEDDPGVFPEGDVDGNGSLNIGDAVYLVQYIFFSGSPPAPCP